MPLKTAADLNAKTFVDPKIAADYLSAVYEECAEDGQFDAFLVAIRDLIQNHDSMAQVAQRAGIGRQAIYQMLSENGNPKLDNFVSILKAIGLKLKFEPEADAA
jgi:probable addiction module antidote protein